MSAGCGWMCGSECRLMHTAVRDAGMCGVLSSSWGTSEYVGAQVNTCIHCLSEPQIEYSEYVWVKIR